MLICLHCNQEFNGSKERKFCSSSCSATNRNTGLKRTQEEKEKVRKSFKNTLNSYPKTRVFFKTCVYCSKNFWTKKSEGKLCSKKCQNNWVSIISTGLKNPKKTYRGKPVKIQCKIETKKEKIINKNCIVCSAIFIAKNNSKSRKTCSKECHYQLLSGKIGHTTHPEHLCKDGTKLILGSSWEKKIAVFLDENNIKWIRPKALDYIDETGKIRKYFPDFYLPNLDIYLDPKNPMKIKNDQYKLDYFKDKIILYYGTISNIKEKLVGASGNAPDQSR